MQIDGGIKRDRYFARVAKKTGLNKILYTQKKWQSYGLGYRRIDPDTAINNESCRRRYGRMVRRKKRFCSP